MNKRSIWGITGHSHASNGMSLAAEVVAKKRKHQWVKVVREHTIERVQPSQKKKYSQTARVMH